METKKAYEKKMQAQLREWRAKIDLLKARADKADANARIKYYEMIEDFRSKIVLAEEKLHEAKLAKDEAWKDLKTGLEHAGKELKESWDQAVSRFKK